MKLTYQDFWYHMGAIAGYLNNEKVMRDLAEHKLLDMGDLEYLKTYVNKLTEQLAGVCNDPRCTEQPN